MKEEFKPRCPYQGLIPYKEGDAHFFFGREQETHLIIANLFASSLTLLYGASGVGKSSILRAGVTHSLRQREDLLVVVFSTWQSNPLDDLKADVAKAGHARINAVAGSAARSAVPAPAAAASDAPRQSESLLAYLTDWSTKLNCNLLIILDQFEEYFLYQPQGDAFAIEFAQTVSLSQAPISFLISIREDSLAKLDRFEKGIPAIFDNYLRLEHLDREAARAAITKPLDHYNALYMAGGAKRVEIESQLVDEVLEQVKTGEVLLGEAGRGGKHLSGAEARIETPFLQMVMTRLWNREMEQGSNLLRLQTLAELGNAESIIRTHLDGAMSTLTPDEQEIAASIFHYLVTPSGSKIAHSTINLAYYTKLRPTQIQPVLNKLSAGAARILQSVAPPADPKSPPHYEIYHDVLAAAILDWRRRFMLVQEWTRHTEQMGLEQRRVMQLRIGLIAISLLICTVIGSLVVTRSAKTQERIALSREVAAVALNNISKDSELSFLLALEAVEMEPTEEAVESLRKTLMKYPLLAIMTTRHVVRHVSFSPDGRFLLTGGEDQTARLWDITNGKFVRKFIADKGRMSTAIFSPDGTLIATATDNNNLTVQIWETNSEKLLTELTGGHKEKINQVAFSPDSNLVVTASQDNTARIWDARTGRSMTPALSHDQHVIDAAFSPDGMRIVTACYDGNAYIWETKEGRRLTVLKGSGDPVYTASFSPDGKRIVTASYDMTARVWNAETGELELELRHYHSVYTATFSPDGRFIFTLEAGHSVHKWDATTGQQTTDPAFNELRDVGPPRLSPDGQLIASGEISKDAHVWDAVTGKQYKTFVGHKQQVNDAAFSPNGYNIVTASVDGTARVWRVRSRDFFNLDYAERVSFSPDGRFIIGANHVWDFVTGERVRDASDEDFYTGLSSFSPDGKYILVIDNYQNSAQIRDANSRDFLRELQGHKTNIASAAFSMNGKLLVTVGEGHSIQVWDVNTGQSVAEFNDEASIFYSTALSPDGKYVIAGNGKGNARIWDVQTKQLVRDLVGHSAPIMSVAYSPDGKSIVTGSDDQRVVVWDAQTGERKVTLQGDSGGLKSVAFSPDGRLILTASSDGKARVWAWPSSESDTPVVLGSDAGHINSAIFSPDGMFILTTSGGVANIYPRESFVPLPELIEMAKVRVQRPLTCAEKKIYLHQRLCLP